MNTKDWRMGYYPAKTPPRLSVEGALEELQVFGHRQSAKVLRQALIRSGAIRCRCGEMLQNTKITCNLHPEVRVRTAYERMDFEKAFNEQISKGN